MPNPTVQAGAFTRKGTSEVTLDQFNRQLRQSPLWATWMAQNGIRTDRPIKLSKDQQKAFAAYLQTNGVPVPKDFHIDAAGNMNQTSRTGRNLKIAGIVGGVALGGLGLAGIGPLGGVLGGATGGAGAATGGAGAATGAGAGTSAGSAVASGAIAVAKKPSLWSKIAGPLVEQGIPAAAGLVGTKMQVDAQKRASDIEAQAAQQALDWQKQQYATRQNQLAPAIGVGNAATVKLGELMGIRTPEGGYRAETQIDRGGVPVQQPSNMGSSGATGATAPGGQPTDMVPMRAPSGMVKMVSAAEVPHYQQLGAQVVQ